jgi:hypothetical protein
MVGHFTNRGNKGYMCGMLKLSIMTFQMIPRGDPYSEMTDSSYYTICSMYYIDYYSREISTGVFV